MDSTNTCSSARTGLSRFADTIFGFSQKLKERDAFFTLSLRETVNSGTDWLSDIPKVNQAESIVVTNPVSSMDDLRPHS